MLTSEELFDLPSIDVDRFAENLLLESRRETYLAMTEDQKAVVKHAIRYGQMQMKNKGK